MRRALLALAAGGLCCAAQAKVYVCVEDGTRVFRDRPCADAEEEKPAEKAVPEEFFDLPKPATATIPIFNQVIAFTLPAHWKPVHQSATKATYVAEFVPRAESAQAWREMITVQGFRDLAQQPRASPINFLAKIAAGMEKVCGGDTVTQSLGAVTVDSYEAQAAIIGCASLPRAAPGARAGQGEIAYYLAIKGTHELYVIQHAVRGGAFDKRKAPITEANAAQILEALQPVKVCDPVDSREQCAARKPR
jgi:hypothetical protein